MKCKVCQNEMDAIGDETYDCDNCDTWLDIWNGIEEWTEPEKDPYFVTGGPEYEKRKASTR